ncbi:protein suppressor of variegation 3-7 [Drosophila ficusphila]|uniref:protein suppressor of variegation 3-7 n=1 Tax=Drosophila ficusphila TaxID=30025 RepID=UPI0007E7B291|nr:protein suppressor of variegation 3-7 [Drosophila ficusphila]
MANLQLTQEKLNALRSEYRPRRPCALLKYPRPKTKPEYQAIYPWLLPDETDPHFVFCAVCECRLSCKRSDLGKHEGSIKHSENAQRKSLPAKLKTEAEGSSSGVMKWEYNEDEEGLLPYGTDPPDDETEEEEGEADETEGDCEEAEDDEDQSQKLEAHNDLETEPVSKQQRRISETDSQHSGMLDYLPLHVTINELPSNVPPVCSSYPTPSSSVATTAAPPCRITIKKVPAPSTPPTAVCQAQEISSKATITPIHTTPSYAARQLQSFQLQPVSPVTPPRDSLELFFDSICATVRSLPPKLATEGKIRVMQLIGELELRALGEQEATSQSAGHQGHDLTVSFTGGAADPPGSGQQNSTVASTTK